METLHGVDIEVPRGKITTIIGPNGSGKSTLLKTVSGLVRTWRGAVLLEGEDVARRPAHQRVRRGLCMVPQGRVVFPFLTVEGNLRMCAYPVRSDKDLAERSQGTVGRRPRDRPGTRQCPLHRRRRGTGAGGGPWAAVRRGEGLALAGPGKPHSFYETLTFLKEHAGAVLQ
jgi:energy-coupling factor transporter ATP-binding protein EcfA2